MLPLPNGNWNAIVDDWCCHPDPFAKKLLPRAEDCLLGDTFLLVARDESCKETVSEEMNPVGAEDGQDPKVSQQMKYIRYSLNLCFDPNYLFNDLLFLVLPSKTLILYSRLTHGCARPVSAPKLTNFVKWCSSSAKNGCTNVYILTCQMRPSNSFMSRCTFPVTTLKPGDYVV